MAFIHGGKLTQSRGRGHSGGVGDKLSRDGRGAGGGGGGGGNPRCPLCIHPLYASIPMVVS